MLAHERVQDFDFDELWSEIPSTLDRTEAQLERILTAGSGE
jgi:hypothetical protein